MKIETGVMVMKDGMAWGVKASAGGSTEYGWVAPEVATIHNPEFCESVTDVLWPNSHYTSELESAKLVSVKRTTIVDVTGICGRGKAI